MTRRDFVFLAEIFHNRLASHERPMTAHERGIIVLFAHDMALALAQGNAAFDQELFLRNCGVYGGA